MNTTHRLVIETDSDHVEAVAFAHQVPAIRDLATEHIHCTYAGITYRAPLAVTA